ncbi:MAG: PLDc_N domain-containing protein [Micromonosporaceae bacterium]|nr:PLDc_N domain-containing protein [Micromonosporaceae bacterium]
MGRLLVVLVFSEIALLTISLIDCLSSDREEVQALPKAAWLLVILIIPLVGPILWFAFGRPGHSGSPNSRPGDRPGGSGAGRQPSARRRPLAPDDDPEFLKGLAAAARRANEDRLLEWESDLHRREEELRRRAEREASGEEPPEDPVR